MDKHTNPSDAYLKALGAFVHTYAEIEYCMSGVFRVAVSLTGHQSVTLVSGLRVRAIMDNIKRYFDGIDGKLPENLERAFSKLQELTTIRDRILHYGNRADGDVVKASQAYRQIPQRAKTWEYSTSDLIDLEEDAKTVLGLLTVYWIDERYFNSEPYDGWRPIALRAWRYKESEPANKQVKSQKTPRKPKPQPQSSEV